MDRTKIMCRAQNSADMEPKVYTLFVFYKKANVLKDTVIVTSDQRKWVLAERLERLTVNTMLSQA